MAIILRDLKLVFIMVPGTGCSVIGGVMTNQMGGEYLPKKNIYRDGRLLVCSKHASLDTLMSHGVVTAESLADHLVFCTLRNPFDRFVTDFERLQSDWAVATTNKRRNKDRVVGDQATDAKIDLDRKTRRKERGGRLARTLGFDKWMRLRLRFWAMKYGKGETGSAYPPLYDHCYPLARGLSRFIRYENLSGDLESILRERGYTGPVAIPHRNKTPGKRHYTEYYSPSLRAKIESRMGRELEMHGYSFDCERSAATSPDKTD